MPSKWTTVDPMTNFAAFLALPNVPGCYAIYCDGVLSYIGSAERLRTRINYHLIQERYSNNLRCRWGQFSRFLVKYRTSEQIGDWLMMEYRLIRRLSPRFNVVGRKDIPKEDREWRESMRAGARRYF